MNFFYPKVTPNFLCQLSQQDPSGETFEFSGLPGYRFACQNQSITYVNAQIDKFYLACKLINPLGSRQGILCCCISILIDV